MGFIVAPRRKADGPGRPAQRPDAPHQARAASTRCRSPWSRSSTTSRSTRAAPAADLLAGDDGPAAPGYYALVVPRWLAPGPARPAPPRRRAELDRFGAACRTRPGAGRHGRRPCSTACSRRAARRRRGGSAPWPRCWTTNGFDRVQHEQIRADLRRGRIGLAQNRLPASTVIRGRAAGRRHRPDRDRRRRRTRRGRAGRPWRGARWRWSRSPPGPAAAGRPGPAWSRRCTRSASSAAGTARSSRCTWPRAAAAGRRFGTPLPARRHHQLPDARADRRLPRRGAATTATPARCSSRRGGPSACGWCRWPATCASPGRRRPSRCSTSRPRRCARACTRALIDWARQAGEGSDYTDNVPAPVPAPGRPLVRGAEPAAQRRAAPACCAERPQLQYLLVHNIDTLGADLDPALLGLHIAPGRRLTFEVIRPAHRRPRRRAGPRGRPRAPARGAGDAPRGGRVRPVLLQLADHLGRHRPAAGRLRPDRAPTWRTTGAGGRRRPPRWPRGCRPTSRSRT